MTEKELRDFRAKAEAIAKLPCSVTFERAIDCDGHFREEWTCFAWKGPEIPFMARSHAAMEVCLGEFDHAKQLYIETLSNDMQQAKEAYESAAGSV